MAILVGGTRRVDFDQIGIFAFTGGATTFATATVYRVSSGSGFNELTGTFTYDSAGILIGGTITGWKQSTGGGVAFTATGLSIPVTEFLGYLTAHDNDGLLNAVLGGDDKITGSAFNDELYGAGNDTMAGGGGDDLYTVSEKGDQVIETAGQGTDTVYATIDGYVLPENVENLLLFDGASKGTGNSLNNFIAAAGAGKSRLDGDLGDDTLDGGDGADTLIGGAGNDTYVLASLADDVVENADEGTDTIRAVYLLDSFSLNSPVYAHIENLKLEAAINSKGEGNDSANAISGVKYSSFTYQLDGLGGDDTLSGGQGNDTLNGGAGADVMIGFGGDDTYKVDDAKDKVVELAGPSGGYDIVSAEVDHVLAANVEELNLLGNAVSGTGNALGNWILGNAVGNKLLGLAGDDNILGGDGDDSLQGGSGNDALSGDGGNDTLAGGAGNDAYDNVEIDDTIVELAGQGIDLIRTALSEFTLDTKARANIENLDFSGGPAKGTGNSLNNYIEGTLFNDTLDGGLGNDTLDGIGGDDLLIGGKGSDSFFVDSSNDAIIEQSTHTGIDTVYSTAAAFSLDSYSSLGVENLVLLAGAVGGTGNALANVIKGNDGDNELNGGLGNDTLIGGKGDDIYFVDSAKDKVVELGDGGTYDTVRSTAVTYTLGANIENLGLNNGAISGIGNGLANIIVGNESDNIIAGMAGDDTLDGYLGNNTLEGGMGNDSLLASDGGDRLSGGAGNDTLNGQGGADTLLGGAGDDYYYIADLLDVVIEGAGQGDDTIETYSQITSFSLDTKALANVEHLILTTGVGGKAVGNDLNNRITTNNGNDSLAGGVGNDTLDGRGGADTMVGGKGNDFYFIDNVNDIVTEQEGEGTDTVIVEFAGTADMSVNLFNVENMIFTGTTGIGNALDNLITGNALINVIAGGVGNDTLDGAANDDELSGGAGNDSLIGGDGHDILTGDAGNDTMAGGKGNDQYKVDSAADKVVEAAGADGGFDRVFVTGVTSYTLSANVEALSLGAGAANGTGNAQNNDILGNTLNNKLSGMGGNDTLDGGVGADTLIGGAGNDSYAVDSVDDKVVEAAGQGIDTLDTVLTNYSLDTKALANVENLNLGGGAGVGVGNGLNNNIRGWTQNDTLIGGAGNDTLNGHIGADSLIGGKGDDFYIFDNVGDTVTEQAGEGIDTIVTSGNLSLAAFANVENAQLLAGAGAANVDGNARNNLVLGNTSANKISGAAGNDTLNGGSDNDTLNGDEANDSLIGLDGDDSLNGGAGADTMAGGEGDDVYVVDSAGDKIAELAGAGSGYDIVYSGAASYVLSANIEQLNLDMGAINGTGNAQANLINGSADANKLLGMGGDDSIYGGAGNDTVDGGLGDDAILGGSGNDSLLGGAGNDTLESGIDADTLVGGAGNDRYILADDADKVVEAAGQGIDEIVASGNFSITLAANVENGNAWFDADIAGNELANVIDGGSVISGHNLLSGGSGNDTLIGGAGWDTLTGGAGHDNFAFANIDSALDRVTDFDAGPLGDALDLSNLLSGYDPGGSDAGAFVKFVNGPGGTTVQVDYDGAANGVNFISVCLLEGVTLVNVNQAVMEGNLLLA